MGVHIYRERKRVLSESHSYLNLLAVNHCQSSSTVGAVLLAQRPVQPGGGQVKTLLLEHDPTTWTLMAEVTWSEKEGDESEVLLY